MNPVSCPMPMPGFLQHHSQLSILNSQLFCGVLLNYNGKGDAVGEIFDCFSSFMKGLERLKISL